MYHCSYCGKQITYDEYSCMNMCSTCDSHYCDYQNQLREDKYEEEEDEMELA